MNILLRRIIWVAIFGWMTIAFVAMLPFILLAAMYIYAIEGKFDLRKYVSLFWDDWQWPMFPKAKSDGGEMLNEEPTHET